MVNCENLNFCLSQSFKQDLKIKNYLLEPVSCQTSKKLQKIIVASNKDSLQIFLIFQSDWHSVRPDWLVATGQTHGPPSSLALVLLTIV